MPAFRIDMLPVLTRRKAIADCARWRPELGTERIVIPIDDPSRVVRFTVSPHHIEHVFNAYEDKGAIVFDATWYSTLEGRDAYLRGLVSGRIDARLDSKVARGIIDVVAKKCDYELRYERSCEFPRISPRFDAIRHRFGYVAGWSSSEAEGKSFFDALVKLDLERRTQEAWVPGPGHFPGEPVFAPSDAGGTDEDAGYVLSLVLDAHREKTYIAVIDARRFAAGPVARVYFDQVIPFGFHGIWAVSARTG